MYFIQKRLKSENLCIDLTYGIIKEIDLNDMIFEDYMIEDNILLL
jgi:hypothetical protein